MIQTKFDKAFLLLAVMLSVPARAQNARSPAPVHLTSEQDHQRVLDELHITSLRRGPDGDPKSPRAANFDESKAVAAGPVYRLLGKKDLGTSEFPPMETAIIDGDIAFRQHSGGHTTGPNWPTFIAFASRYLKASPTAATATAQ